MLRILIALSLVLPVLARAAETLPLGAPDRTKFATFDPKSDKLYIAHATEVTIVDVKTKAIAGHAGGLHSARDIALAPNGRFYVTGSQPAAVTVFETATNAPVTTIPAGQDATAIIYEPVSRRVFVMNDDDGTITVIDAASDKVVTTLTLPGGEGLERAAADGLGNIYLAHSAGHEIVRLDARADRVERHYVLPDCPDPSGLALDTADKLAFVSCLKGLMVVFDTGSGATVATIPIGPGSQSVIYDAARKRIYSSNADTSLSVIAMDGRDKYTALPAIRTPLMARTAAEDFATGTLFLPVSSALVILQP